MEGKTKYKKIIFVIIGVALLYLGILLANIGNFWDAKKDTSNIAIENAIKSAALECYALEGSFPPSIEYLQKNYGLIVNKDTYFYHYQTNGSNILPDIKVLKRWSKNE